MFAEEQVSGPWPAIAEYHNQLNLKQVSLWTAADTNRNTNKITCAISWQNKTGGSKATGTPHAVPVSTIAPTGIERGLNRNPVGIDLT